MKDWILYHLYKSRKVVLHTQFCRHERPLRLNVLDMSCILWYIMFLPFANLHRWCNIIYKYNLFLPWYSWKLLIWHSNMTSFKRFEFKPVVKIIYTYTHCNLWHHRQFITKFYQFLHIRIEIIHGSHMYILFLPRVGLYVSFLPLANARDIKAYPW